MFKSKNKEPRIPSHVPAAMVYDFDIFTDSARGGDVHASHKSLHEAAPDVFYTPHNGGHWIATRMEDVRYIMQTPELFSSRNAPFSPDVGKLGLSLPPQDMDRPDHALYRQLLMKFLSPQKVVKLEAQIRELAIGLIEDVKPEGGCEFMSSVSVPIPVKTFMGLMHMDQSRYEEFVRWANGILASDTMLKRLPPFVRMHFYLKSLIRQRVKSPSDDPISMLLAAEVNGEKLTHKRVLEMCNLLFLAGLDTVTNAMTFSIKHLAENPKFQQQLRDHPEKIPAAVEELLRRYAFPNIPRRVTQDTELGGAKMRAGDRIICSLAAANNDDRVLDNPGEVDLERPKFRHMAFNGGPHNCAGATLARLELRVFLEEWLARMPPFQLEPGFKPEMRGGAVMAMESLKLRW
ncbi:cytochrome P450 [Spongiibacter sp. KMU-166]|uniref:Cytochrome P450 n=1 Tax=Spongiibacter thalassae TaxID=2721624 RepID=A0ABX1GF12_9GAMM|nr:cytochrome P450 [Spongiibacter thalassae]NKI17531.1 cytochrome P450 [Spongiibacter thalassae]